MEEFGVTTGPKLQQYRHLLTALEDKSTLPSEAFNETVHKGRFRLVGVETNDEEPEEGQDAHNSAKYVLRVHACDGPCANLLQDSKDTVFFFVPYTLMCFWYFP
jgi:hypothetical protein